MYIEIAESWAEINKQCLMEACQFLKAQVSQGNCSD